MEMFWGLLSLNYQILIKNNKKKTLINAPVNHYGSMVILPSMFLGMSTDFNIPSSIKLSALWCGGVSLHYCNIKFKGNNILPS